MDNLSRDNIRAVTRVTLTNGHPPSPRRDHFTAIMLVPYLSRDTALTPSGCNMGVHAHGRILDFLVEDAHGSD